MLERQATDCMAEDALAPRQMNENYTPPTFRNHLLQKRRLPLDVAGPVVQASMLQMLTPQQALEAAACGKAVVRAECVPAQVMLPAPPAMQCAARA